MSTPEGRLLKALEADPSIRLAVLFGSAARRDERPGSDLDVGVLGTPPESLSALQVSLERAAGRPIDLVDLETAPPLLRFEIARDGRLLLERGQHPWSDFKARAMVDWWDWAPTARLFQKAAVARLRREVARGQS